MTRIFNGVKLLVLILLGGLLMSVEYVCADDLFPFAIPWDDSSPSVANVSHWNEKPAGKAGFISVHGNHFVTADGKRIRFLGTNLCFAGCFPPHDVAEKVAARMAKFGINIVRLHHTDSQYFPRGILDGSYKDKQHLSAEALDRLDYLIAQLKKNGIYVDINLHISRKLTKADGIPFANELPKMDKGVDNFYPPMIELQKKYARDLLSHVNKYTGNAYSEEPSVAMIEINNENSLTNIWRRGTIDNLPEPYLKVLDERWNAWLKKRYKNTDNLRRAWGKGESELGEEMLKNRDFSNGTEGWVLQLIETAQAEMRVTSDGPNGKPAVEIDVVQKAATSWWVQFYQADLAFRESQPYTLSFWAKADPPRRIGVNSFRAHQPWGSLGLSTSVNIGTEWKQHTFHFRASETENVARITISGLAAQEGKLWVTNFSLRPGGIVSLPKGQSLEDNSIARITRAEFGGRTEAAQRDLIEFLCDIEEEYWSGMARYLRNEVGVRMPVTGTQMGYTPAFTHEAMDYYDAHAYWHHPSFPGRPWDPRNWWVTNVSMVNSNGGTLPGLAVRRIDGKPYTISEYNSPAPNTYNAETYLLLAAYAALQDWDGIFSFAYSHNDRWNIRRIPNFFDIKSHPTKLVTMSAAAALFRRGDVAAAKEAIVVHTNREAALDRADSYPAQGTIASTYGVEPTATLVHKVSVNIKSEKVGVDGPQFELPKDKVYVSDTQELIWNRENSLRSVVTVNTSLSKAVIGYGAGKRFELSEVTITPGESRHGWSVITATVMEGKSFSSSGRILLTATGHAENPGWGWETEGDRATVRNNWGREPSVVEGIPAQIILPVPSERVRVFSLDERGQRKSEILVKSEGGNALIEIGPREKTLWYEVIIRG